MNQSFENFILLVLMLFVIGNYHGEANAAEESTIPEFVVKGTVSWQGFESSNTNIVAISKIEGTFFFSYSNGVWDVQFIYPAKTNVEPQGQGDGGGTIVDCRRIPDGIRQTIISPTNAYAPGVEVGKIMPLATAKPDKFPSWNSQELFLPWLSLCPNAELPLVSSNLMRIYFQQDLLGNPKNEGTFKLKYIEPNNTFIADLVVTNNGVIFLADGGTAQLPGSFKDGYPQFKYEVLKTTNCGGITFPLETVLRQFVPTDDGKSPKDIYPGVISRLQVILIDVGGKDVIPRELPSTLVVRDTRPPGLKGGEAMTYGVANEQWPSITNHKYALMLKSITHRPSATTQEAQYKRKRETIYTMLVILTAGPLVGILLWKTKTNKKTN